MSDPVLHIKDSFYFEVPKPLARAHYLGKDFPAVWVKNDDQFQSWEAHRLYERMSEIAERHHLQVPSEHELTEHWEHWQHEGSKHQNFRRPLDVYIESLAAKYQAQHNALPRKDRPTHSEYLTRKAAEHDHDVWAAQLIEAAGGAKGKEWRDAKDYAGGDEAIAAFKKDTAINWSADKIAKYNEHLSGKILLDDQPFGRLRNLYEAESGFCISKLMIVEVIVGILLFAVFSWVASRVRSGAAPRGRLWNILEVFLLFIRDQIARPAIGAHHDEHEEEHAHEKGHHAGEHPTGIAAGHGEGGAGIGGAPVEVSDVHSHKHGHHQHGHHNPYADADRFVPLLWTIFFFVLGCNLFGLLPWLGGPTASFGVTFALALCTFIVVCIAGMMKFGVLGFFANQIPSMDLPLPLAIVLKPMIFLIEMMGLLIKHLVLSIRLLANMVAGHLVILGILAVAFGTEAALAFHPSSGSAWAWWIAAPISIAAATVFNVLELFVAFLQAYIFTFLSALFIGASVHKH
jgi:F-type H+-transporting ATPase subunit a